MNEVTTLADYADERGNRIEYAGTLDTGIRVVFTGENNRLVVDPGARLTSLAVHFDCSDGLVSIGASRGVPAFSANMRVGQDARIQIGANVSSTARVGMSAVEGAVITVGDDVMFASEIQLRADDGHPIFDVRSGKRVNAAKPITIGAHVWVGWGAVVLGGTEVGEGSVLGMRAVVKGKFPNNCVVAGVPARVVRRDVAWERPHLSRDKPYYKPDASTVKRSPYWHRTAAVLTPSSATRGRLSGVRRLRAARSRLGAAIRRLRRARPH